MSMNRQDELRPDGLKVARAKETEVLAVDLESWDGKVVHMENNGVVTNRLVGDDGEAVCVLHGRSAFRGFVMGLTELLNYELLDAYDADGR